MIASEGVAGQGPRMNLAEIEILPTAQKLTLAYLGEAERAKLEPGFALDFRLARIVGAATEPMLGQMRIAWWRDMLSKPVGDRPRGDFRILGRGRCCVDRSHQRVGRAADG